MKPAEPPDEQPLSEVDIQAYADGILAPERTTHVHRYLAIRPGEAHRVAFYERLNAQMKQAFRPAHAPFPTPALPQVAWRAARIRRAAVRALLALALALVASSGWIVASQIPYDALTNAALMELERASEHHFHAPLPASPTFAAAPDLAPAGLRLATGSTLKFGPIARASEFVYENADGRPVVLLSSLALAAPVQSQWMAHRIGDTWVFTWAVRHHRYVLAAKSDTMGLMRAADLLLSR